MTPTEFKQLLRIHLSHTRMSMGKGQFANLVNPFLLHGSIELQKVVPIWLEYHDDRVTKGRHRASTLDDWQQSDMVEVFIGIEGRTMMPLVRARRITPGVIEIVVPWAQGDIRAFVPI